MKTAAVQQHSCSTPKSHTCHIVCRWLSVQDSVLQQQQINCEVHIIRNTSILSSVRFTVLSVPLFSRIWCHRLWATAVLVKTKSCVGFVANLNLDLLILGGCLMSEYSYYSSTAAAALYRAYFRTKKNVVSKNAAGSKQQAASSCNAATNKQQAAEHRRCVESCRYYIIHVSLLRCGCNHGKIQKYQNTSIPQHSPWTWVTTKAVTLAVDCRLPRVGHTDIPPG